MHFDINTERKPVTIAVILQAQKPVKVSIIARDSAKPNTFYIKRSAYIKGVKTIELPLPVSPEKLSVTVVNSNTKTDSGIQVKKIYKTKLKTWQVALTKKTTEFIKFAEQFSENAGILSAGIYGSDKGNFTIKYFNVIKLKDGRNSTTPARINNQTGVIEVSRKYFVPYTIGMRMIILLHEYAHFYLNKNIQNEIQADLNGLYIYLGLGYSRVEAHRAFLSVFSLADTKQNEQRYQFIKEYIKKFDAGKIAKQNEIGQIF